MSDRSDAHNVIEQHYYQEKKRKVTPILDKKEQRKIDQHMRENDNFPPKNTTKEEGYSAFVMNGSDPEINAAMLKKAKINDTTFIVSRLADAPKLPISCLASTEHVVAMQSDVQDFVSEVKPVTKKKVMFQILIKLISKAKNINIETQIKRLKEVICENDNKLKQENIHITYQNDTNVFCVEVGTQVADIQQIIRNLNLAKRYKVLNCDFNNVELNQGICLLNKNAENPIHALTNIINTQSQKGFLERDAGLTSGLSCRTYQDGFWTFNFFDSLDEMKKKTGYKNNAHAIKVFRK